MVMQAVCSDCGSDKIALEFRDTWFDTDPVPREAYGMWLVCTKCGHSWPEEGEALW